MFYFSIYGEESSQLALTPSFFRRVGIPPTRLDMSENGVPQIAIVCLEKDDHPPELGLKSPLHVQVPNSDKGG